MMIVSDSVRFGEPVDWASDEVGMYNVFLAPIGSCAKSPMTREDFTLHRRTILEQM